MHGFSYQNFKITPPEGFCIDQEAPSDLFETLNQEFTFLGYGGESLVFASKDGNWVLKVFKKHRLYPFKQLQWIHFPYILEKNLKSRLRIYNRFWESVQLSSQCRDLSYIKYIHTPNTLKNMPKVCLIDPIGSKHLLDLDPIYFVIQKRGQLFKQVYLSTQDCEQKKLMLNEAVSFYKHLNDRKLVMWDNAITRNLGWHDNKPFLIDTGSMKQQNPQLDELAIKLSQLKAWVLKYDPERLEYVSELIAGH